jgi:very-short-patch-repair endonuclease
MTDAERALWPLLRNHGFHPNVILDGWIVDFYRSDVKVAVEVDGSVHEQDFKKRQDAAKDADSERLGVRLLRFKNEVVLRDPRKVAKVILAAVEQRKPEAPVVPLSAPPETVFHAVQERQRAQSQALSTGEHAALPRTVQRGVRW